MWSDYQAGVTGLVIFPAFFPRVLPGVGTRLFLSWPTGPGGARADCWLAHTTLYSQSSDARLPVRVTGSGGVLTILAEFYPPQLSYLTPGRTWPVTKTLSWVLPTNPSPSYGPFHMYRCSCAAHIAVCAVSHECCCCYSPSHL